MPRLRGGGRLEIQQSWLRLAAQAGVPPEPARMSSCGKTSQKSLPTMRPCGPHACSEATKFWSPNVLTALADDGKALVQSQ